MIKKKIKVFSLATTYPESTHSTKPKFVHLLNKELVNLGVNVLAITPYTKGAKTKEILDGVNIFRFMYLPVNSESSLISIPDQLEKSKIGYFKVFLMISSFFINTFFTCLRERPDIIHGQWAFPGGYIAYIMSKIFNKKSVITVHFAEIPLLKKFNLLKKIVVRALNHSSEIVAVSNFTKNELVNLGVKEDRITIIKPIPNFIKKPIIQENSFEELKIKFTHSKDKIIFFLGRLVERKGVEFLIQALPLIKSKNFHLIISGEGHLLEKLKKLTKSLDLNHKVTFFESPTDSEIAMLGSISDVFVCPSIVDSKGETEGLGLVIVEAMAFGLPVIATSVGGIVDIIKNEENGILIPQKDPKSIANAIERLFQDENLTKKILKRSNETVMEFSPKIIANEYLRVYKKILNIED